MTIRNVSELLFISFAKMHGPSLKLSVPYEKDATKRSNSKQRMMLFARPNETVRNGSNREEAMILKIRILYITMFI